MIKSYKFEIKGVARNAQTWTTQGIFQCDLNEAFDTAMRDSFLQLTNGKAVYGQPGKSCQGPYDIISVKIEQVKQ